MKRSLLTRTAKMRATPSQTGDPPPDWSVITKWSRGHEMRRVLAEVTGYEVCKQLLDL